jgi:hypothetical protein
MPFTQASVSIQTSTSDVNNSEWTAADDAVACLLPMSARNNRILHIDGDSFFASCEIALDPKLEGRPVWVGGGRRGDGIVIAANRQAKKYGIKTGTACFEAKRLCPSGVLCRPHYDAYRELSRQMFLILEEYAPTLCRIRLMKVFWISRRWILMCGVTQRRRIMFKESANGF